jgi:hypothetical protein
MGHALVIVGHWEWNGCRGFDERVQLLRGKLADSVPRVSVRAAATESSDFYTEESEGGNELQDWAAGAPDAPGDALLQSKKLQLLALVAGLDRGAAAGGLQRKVTTRIWRALHALNPRAAVCHASPRGDELWATCHVALCRRCWRPRRRWSVRALWASILKSPIYSDLIQ